MLPATLASHVGSKFLHCVSATFHPHTTLVYRADVLCLQDVDCFHQWWSPQLTSAGYDSLFKQRTSRAAMHRDGVVIAWKRDVFDLFRSGEMELNRYSNLVVP